MEYVRPEISTLDSAYQDLGASAGLPVVVIFIAWSWSWSAS